MSTCPQCQTPMADADRVSGIDSGPDDAITGLYDCRVCHMWFVVRSDGTTAEAVFEDE